MLAIAAAGVLDGLDGRLARALDGQSRFGAELDSLADFIDFGVARSTDGDVALTTMHTDLGQLVGTLFYMCPEQFDGTTADLDVRADVYSLGVVFYEILAGRQPYDLQRLAVYEVARVVNEVEPPLLSTVNPRLRGDRCYGVTLSHVTANIDTLSDLEEAKKDVQVIDGELRFSPEVQ